MKIEIKNRLTNNILFEFETKDNTLKKTIEKSVKERANLTGANLAGAYLTGANLTGANLTGAKYKDINIKKISIYTGLYKYIAMAIISEDNKHYIRLGCFTRLLSDWDNDFWNNQKEFPNIGDLDSKYRLMAFEFCKQWIELNK